MRLVVFGAGAVGSLFAARLLQAGSEVLLVGRPAHVGAIRTTGLRLEGPREETVALDADVALARGSRADAVILTVKTYDLLAAGEALGTALAAPVPLLATQNGLGVEEEIAQGLGRAGWSDPMRWIVRTVHSIPVTWVGPGRIREAGEGELLFSSREDPRWTTNGERFAALFEAAGFRVRRVPSLVREVWRKALVNAAINPVTADHRILNGQVAEDPWRGQALSLFREARAVAEAEGFDFEPEEAERDLWRVVRATASNRSSMLQDIERGRPTEIEAISGALLALGERRGLALPATRRIVKRLRARAGPRR